MTDNGNPTTAGLSRFAHRTLRHFSAGEFFVAVLFVESRPEKGERVAAMTSEANSVLLQEAAIH